MTVLRSRFLTLVFATLLGCADSGSSPEPEEKDDAASDVADDDIEEDDDDDDAPPVSGGPKRDSSVQSSVDASSGSVSRDASGSEDARTSSSTMEDATIRTPPSSSDAAPNMSAPDPLFGDGGLLAPKVPGPPSPNNPKECPPKAPDNPIGSCLGVPVYATCTYGTYACICDWFHWICI